MIEGMIYTPLLSLGSIETPEVLYLFPKKSGSMWSSWRAMKLIC